MQMDKSGLADAANGLPAGAERLPDPHSGLVIYRKDGKTGLRFAARDTDFHTEGWEIALPEGIEIEADENLVETFFKKYPRYLPEPRWFQKYVDWDYDCDAGKVVWEKGSAEEFGEDLAVIARVFARRHGFSIEKGLAFFWGMTGTPHDKPALSLKSSDFTLHEDFHRIWQHLEEFCETLQSLQPGLFARNYPIGCCRGCQGRSHRHYPQKFFAPVIRDRASSGHRAMGDEGRYSAIEAAARS
jgi:hypothetical protein